MSSLTTRVNAEPAKIKSGFKVPRLFSSNSNNRETASPLISNISSFQLSVSISTSSLHFNPEAFSPPCDPKPLTLCPSPLLPVSSLRTTKLPNKRSLIRKRTKRKTKLDLRPSDISSCVSPVSSSSLCNEITSDIPKRDNPSTLIKRSPRSNSLYFAPSKPNHLTNNTYRRSNSFHTSMLSSSYLCSQSNNFTSMTNEPPENDTPPPHIVSQSQAAFAIQSINSSSRSSSISTFYSNAPSFTEEPLSSLNNFFKNSSLSSVQDDSSELLRRFFDVTPDLPLAFQVDSKLNRSCSEEIPRYPSSNKTKQLFSHLSPSSRHSLQKLHEHDQSDSFRLKQMISPRPSTNGLMTFVKGRRSSKTSTYTNSGLNKAVDRRFLKILAKLSNAGHSTQISLKELQEVTPWFTKVTKFTPETDDGSLLSDLRVDSTASSWSKTSSFTEEQTLVNQIETLHLEAEVQPTSDFSQKRWYLACEIVNTEASYSNNLRATLELFRDPIRQRIISKNMGIPSNMLLLGIFCHHDTLLDLSTKVKQALENTTLPLHWHPDLSCIGPIFLTHMNEFRCYVNYVKEYVGAIELVQKCEDSQLFRDILVKGAQNNPARQTLKEMLILPVQRLARYSLLLQTLRNVTTPSHPDYEHLTNAVNYMVGLASEADQAQREREESATAQAIFSSVENCPTMLRNAGFKRVFVTDAHELHLRRPVRLFIYPHFIMVTTARRHWSLDIRRWKFLTLIPIVPLQLIQVKDQDVHTGVSILYSSSPSPRYYVLRHYHKQAYLGFIHIMEQHLRTLP